MSLVSQLLRPEELVRLTPDQRDLIEQHLEASMLKHLASSPDMQKSLANEARNAAEAMTKTHK